MAHLLMIDSWVMEMGYFLPEAILRLGHTFTLVTRDLHYYLRRPPPTGHHPLLDAQAILTFETNDTPALLDFVERYRAFQPYDGVITSCDYYLGVVAQIAGRLGLPTTSPAAFDTARLKHRMRQALADAGLPNPAFHLTSSWEEARAAAAEIGYPVVLKPVDLCAGMFVALADDEAGLHRAFVDLEGFPVNNRKQPRPPLFLIEEYLEGPEFSVEGFVYAGDPTIIGITDKSLTGYPAFIENGHMAPAALDPGDADALADLVRRALAAVGYSHGMFHTEVKLTPAGPRIVEINVRCCGGHISELYRRVLGVDPVEIMVQLALGQRPRFAPVDTGIKSAAVQYFVPPRGGYVTHVRGTETLADDPSIVHWHLNPLAGTHLREPVDNNDCLGHVVCVDREGLSARARAEAAIDRIELVYAEGAAT
jgi:biotin carboxylase